MARGDAGHEAIDAEGLLVEEDPMAETQRGIELVAIAGGAQADMSVISPTRWALFWVCCLIMSLILSITFA